MEKFKERFQRRIKYTEGRRGKKENHIEDKDQTGIKQEIHHDNLQLLRSFFFGGGGGPRDYTCFYNGASYVKGLRCTLEGVAREYSGENIFILLNPQTVWSKEYIKLNNSTWGRNSQR